MQKDEIVLEVHIEAASGREQDLQDHLAALLDPSRKEPGCLIYELHSDPDRPGHLFFFEKFRDQIALDEHLASPHFQEFVAYRASGSDPVANINVTRWNAV